MQAWEGFKAGVWQEEINVRDFILTNYTEYRGSEDFLSGATERTKTLNEKYLTLCEKERSKRGVLDVDVTSVSSLLSYPPGYLDRENELIVGLQTARPLVRGVNPFGGMKMCDNACRAYGYELSDEVKNHFKYKTTHNDGVFRVYTPEMLAARKNNLITGLPDAYGRGRIIGDYRRAALYGVDRLIEQKKRDKLALGNKPMTEANIRLLEELYKQIDFLEKLKELALRYGKDISGPAKNALDAVQWVYFAYLAAIKEQNGAAMSLGRVSTFLDVYFERDIRAGHLDEAQAQEIIDQFILKLRMARMLRTPEYNELFAGDPMWITESIGGMALDGRTLVTRTSFRFLNSLYTLGPAPEPNLTILWSQSLPENFKNYCMRASIVTDALQYESDDLMRPIYGDDYGIACCVSAMKLGKQMQFFGARCNVPKLLLMALNGGRDEKSGDQVGPAGEVFPEKPLIYEEVYEKFKAYAAWLCGLYVNTMNIIHYMHDKYAYEKIQMALHDTEVERLMAFGIAGLSVAADSLSAIKYARVTPVWDSRGLISEFDISGNYPKFGNDDDRVDQLACDITALISSELKKHPAYKDAIHTLSVLTITSNVVYGKKTGATPDGRAAGQPFAPGGNPMHGREECGALASLNSVAKLPYDACRDGVSCTFSITPGTLGSTSEAQVRNLSAILDGYFAQGAHHLNVNVLRREQLIEAMEAPEKYSGLTIRVSGYAVHFTRLSREHQLEIIARTFHSKM
ncbi:MAG: formate C-acetyltransferase [Clostridia bacterium]|nr:formate C-acetyltransferase [Clostridia bacterium]